METYLPLFTDFEWTKPAQVEQYCMKLEQGPTAGQFKQRPKLLIIDNSPATAEVVKQQLERAGYEVVVFTRSVGAMVPILREHPDLILLDVEMPVLDGPVLCGLIKKDPYVAKIPVLLYSSLNEWELGKKTVECGAQGYIHKSWSMEQVIKRISEYINAR